MKKLISILLSAVMCIGALGNVYGADSTDSIESGSSVSTSTADYEAALLGVKQKLDIGEYDNFSYTVSYDGDIKYYNKS